MKKGFKVGLFGLALSLCFGASALSITSNKEATRLDANTINGVDLIFANDSTCSEARYYSQSGSDLNYLSWSSMTTNSAHYPSIANFTTPTGGSNSTYTVSESSSNKMYNYCYFPFFFYPRYTGLAGMETKIRYGMSITFTISLTKSASGGSAYAHAELFFLGYANSTSDHLTPSLSSSRFDTTEKSGESYSGYHNASSAADSIGCYTKKTNTAETASTTKTFTFDNPSASSQVTRYQLGLFIGCNYGSSYNHQASATISYTINSVSKTNVVASVGSTSYTSFDDAATAAPSGGTVNVLRDTTYSIHESDSHGFTKNLTINLNGNTLSAHGKQNFIGIKNGYSLTINGGGGTIRNVCEDNATNYVLSVSSGATLTLSNVTINKTYGQASALFVAGTLIADSTTRIISASNYITARALTVSGSGSSATLNGTTVTVNQNGVSAIYVSGGGTLRCNAATVSSSFSYAIEIDSGTQHANTVYLSGATTLSKGSSTDAHIAISSVGSNNRIYANNGSSTYLTNNITVSVTGYFNTDTTIVYGDNNSKVSIVSAPATGKSYTRVNNNIVYKSAVYSVSFSNNGGTGTMIARDVQYNNSYVLPSCTFIPPSGKVFIGWKANNAGSLLAVGSSYTVTTDVVFWAQWQNVYTVTYSAGSNGTGSYAHADQLSGTYTLLDFASLTGVSSNAGYRFKNYTVGGVEKDPGETFTLSEATTITVNFEIDPTTYIESHLSTSPSLVYQYTNSGSLEFTHIGIRYMNLISQDLWNALNSESTIQGYGTLLSTPGYLGANQLKSKYESVDGTNVKKFDHAVSTMPDEANAAQKGELVGTYYVWNLFKVVTADPTAQYTVVGYIRTSSDVVFLQQSTVSAKSLATDMLASGEYDEDSLEGSLYALANYGE